LRQSIPRLSEDYSFCHRWRNLYKGEVWVRVGHAITHMGLQEFKSRYADRLAVGPQDPVAPGQSVIGQLRAKADPIAEKNSSFSPESQEISSVTDSPLTQSYKNGLQAEFLICHSNNGSELI
jgi:hypothetical protein